MTLPVVKFYRGALCGFIALAAAAGAAADTVSAAAAVDKAEAIQAPGIEATKAIAEEAFIYGLPIVMNYAVMQEFSVDRDSG
ncbi:MAG: hypothetical protein KDI17_16100, partial [Halioglobus sp.]|nr:hypothetical protein [Halioglobus sp.]